ncbi:hypothetical protein AVEN_68460-1 [Araneus ventricosus]|uniref:Integrase zinc-binding domain-containing protein n=1 Tax=Araneus ventricosus TaxID=182803 RepID=A0A4Y2PUB8_ARAVE|nr:hypothetical protein AVEN_68460-1 [Araneus ventricosus]
MARAQADDEELFTFQSANSNLVFKTISLALQSTPLHCDVSTGNYRPFVPKPFRTTIINMIHPLAHSGAKATTNGVKQRFILTSLRKDCTEFCKHCILPKSPKSVVTLNPQSMIFHYLPQDLVIFIWML